jgi:hypothetical protein
LEKNDLKMLVASLVGVMFFYTALPVYSGESIITMKVPGVN